MNDFYKLLILQFIAHFLSDYIFQTPKCSKEKIENGFKTPYLYKHIAVTFLFSAVLSFQFTFLIFSIIISAIHLIIDGLKKNILRLKKLSKYAFFIDQILHFIIIYISINIFVKFFEINFITDIPKLKYLLYIFGYILIFKPANILIREIFKFYKIKLTETQKDNNELPNAGKLIGNIERILTFTLIILGQYAAIGFIMTAKSVLRFKEAQTQKAEYVLIGTMLSFGIAIMIGIIIQLIIKFI